MEVLEQVPEKAGSKIKPAVGSWLMLHLKRVFDFVLKNVI